MIDVSTKVLNCFHRRVLSFKHTQYVSWSGALTFEYGCIVHVEIDIGAGDAEVDVVYTSFIMSVQYIGYLVPYEDKVQLDTWTSRQLKYRVHY